MKYPNFQDAFISTLSQVMLDGDVVAPRGMETRELLMHSFTVLEPEERLFLSKERMPNPFAQVAETLWMLAGRDDLDYLEEFIPQCRKWSDDGETWRAAYGPRLRNWPSVYGDVRYDEYEYVDQISKVYEKLRDDPDTRQAIITLWDPAEDWIEGSKDYPCNNWLHFIIRNSRLHLNVVVRSNDVIYGLSHVDFFMWSVLQELVANWLGVGIGHMTWNTTSMHVYQRHYQKATNIIKEYEKNTKLCRQLYIHAIPPAMSLPYDKFFRVVNDMLELEYGWRSCTITDLPDPTIGFGDRFTTTCLLLMWVWHAMRVGAPMADIASTLMLTAHQDLGLSAIAYIAAKKPQLGAYLRGRYGRHDNIRYLNELGLL